MKSVLIQDEARSVQDRRTPLPQALVTATDVTRRYGVEGEICVKALRGVSLDVASGKLTAVMGPSGSGKSTLMHILAGLDRPRRARSTIAGTDITDLDDTELTKLRREHIGFIFQFFNLLPMLTAGRTCPPHQAGGRETRPEWIDELTTRVGLSERLFAPSVRLSGGQQQRVAIARALVTRPTVCSPTSRPATSTRPRAERSSRCSAIGRRASARRRHGHARRRMPPKSPTASCSSPTACIVMDTRPVVGPPGSSRRWRR